MHDSKKGPAEDFEPITEAQFAVLEAAQPVARGKVLSTLLSEEGATTELVFDAVPEPLCKHCGKPPGNHKAVTKQCPFGRGSFPSFSATDTYEPRKQRAPRKAAVAPTVAQPQEVLAPAFKTEPSVSESDAARLEWAILTLREIADLGRNKPLGDLYPQAVSVIAALKRVLEPNLVEPMPVATAKPDIARKIVLNLARRLRMARRCYARAVREGYADRVVHELDGAKQEAWNSLQAAKDMFFRFPG